MKENLDELLKTARQHAPQILVDRIVRAVRQEKAASYIEAIEKEDNATIESLAEQLEADMAVMLQNSLDDGELKPDGYVNKNRETLKIIARALAKKFSKVNVSYDLFEALEKLAIHTGVEMDQDFAEVDEPEEFQLARAAIAKAKGSQS